VLGRDCCWQVRRELAAALRDIGLLLGPTTILSFVTQLVNCSYHHLCSAQLPVTTALTALPMALADAGFDSFLPGRHSSTGLSGAPGGAGGFGLQGIVAGLAAGADVCGTTSVAAAAPAAAAAAMPIAGGPDRLLAAGPAACSGAAAAASGDWLPLESALYAANVVLGKQAGEGPEQLVQQVVGYAAASVEHPAGGARAGQGISLDVVALATGTCSSWSATAGAATLMMLAASGRYCCVVVWCTGWQSRVGCNAC